MHRGTDLCGGRFLRCSQMFLRCSQTFLLRCSQMFLLRCFQTFLLRCRSLHYRCHWGTWIHRGSVHCGVERNRVLEERPQYTDAWTHLPEKTEHRSVDPNNCLIQRAKKNHLRGLLQRFGLKVLDCLKLQSGSTWNIRFLQLQWGHRVN